ncbi:hypothetical protein V2J09_018755 [Rumex salicifolius]
MMSLSIRFPLCYSNLPSLLLFTFLILFTSNFLLSPSNAILSPSDGFSNGGRRWIAEVTGDNSSLVLAERRTYRRDPLNDFKRYSGGWNISNQHYWASVGFTAAPFFVVAAAWFVLFGMTLLCTCFYFCCCRKAPYGYSRTCYAISLGFLILFTIAAIIGSFFLYIGQGKFNWSTGTTLNYVVGQADSTANNLTQVSSYLDAAKRIGVNQLTLPENVLTKINNIQTKIDSAASTLSSKTHDNSRKIHRVLDTVLVYFGWLLVAGTFILCGVFLLLHNVVADTCVSMDQWVLNPMAHTALDDILPCVDKATAQDIQRQSKDVNRQLITLMDTVITNVTNGNYPPSSAPLYYNQSGPLLPLLCNPYNADLSDRACAPGEVNYSSANEAWKAYVCQVSADNNGICTTTGRLTPTYYGQLINAANVSYGLSTYSPFLVDLADCSFVRKTFSHISNDHCPGLRAYTRWIYVGLLMVSAGVMLSLIFWVIYARERRHRVYTKQMIGSDVHM